MLDTLIIYIRLNSEVKLMFCKFRLLYSGNLMILMDIILVDGITSNILYVVEKGLYGEKKLKFSKIVSSLKCWMLEFVLGLKKG